MSSKRRSKTFPSEVEVQDDDFRLKVVMLDDSFVDVVMKKNHTGQALLDSVCNSVELIEKEYFGLVYGLSEDSTRHWLNLEKPIRKFVKAPCTLTCEVKFYPKDPSISLQSPLALKFMYLQVQKDIKLSRLRASFASYALLGSLMLQHEVGDVQYVEHLQYAPNDYNLTDALHQEIVRIHRRHHKNLSKEEAQKIYLDKSKTLQMYGVHLRKAKNQFGDEVQVGVCESGVLVLKNSRDIEYRVPWTKIKKVCYQFSNFYMKIRPSPQQEDEIHFFAFHSIFAARKFFQNCREHHLFFRRNTQSNENIFNTTYDAMTNEVDGQSRVEVTNMDVANLLDLSEYGSLNTTHSQQRISQDYTNARRDEEFTDTDDEEGDFGTLVNSEQNSSALGESEATEFEYTNDYNRDLDDNYNTYKSDEVLYEEPFSVTYAESTEYENNSMGRLTVGTAYSEDQVDSVVPSFSAPLQNGRSSDDNENEFPPPPSPEEFDKHFSSGTHAQSAEDLAENEFVTALNSPEEERQEEQWYTPSQEMHPGDFPNEIKEGNHDEDFDNAIMDAVGFDIDKTVDRDYKNRFSFRIKMQESAV